MNYWLYIISKDNKKGLNFVNKKGDIVDANVDNYLDILNKNEMPEIVDWHADKYIDKVVQGDKILIYGGQFGLMGYGEVISLNQSSVEVKIDFFVTQELIKRKIKWASTKDYTLNESGEVNKQKQLKNLTRLDASIRELIFSQDILNKICSTVCILDGTSVEIYDSFEKTSFFYQGCYLKTLNHKNIDYSKKKGRIWSEENDIDESFLNKIFEIEFLKKKIEENSKSLGLGLINSSTNIRDLENIKKKVTKNDNIIDFVKSLSVKIIRNSYIRLNNFHKYKDGKNVFCGKRYVTKFGYIEEVDGVFRKTEKFYKEIGDCLENNLRDVDENEKYLEDLIKDFLAGKKDHKEAFYLALSRGSAQSYFRKIMIEIYKGKCAFCGMSIKSVLEAAHIIPWSKATDEQKADPKNGILLCANHHKMFDDGILSFNKEYVVVKGRKKLSNDQEKWVKDVLNKELLLPDDENYYPNKLKKTN